MLQNAIHPLEELRAVKTQADQHKTQSGMDLTYKQYVHLLVSAASNYDTQFLPKERQGQSSPARRAVYAHDFDVHENADIIESVDGAYDIDTGLDTLHAYATNHSPGSRMPFPRWQSLSDGAKTIWDTLSDTDKALILGNGTAAPPARTLPGNRPGRPSRGQNVHSIDTALFAAYLHEFGIGDSGSDTAPGGSPSYETDPLPPSDGAPTLAVPILPRSHGRNLTELPYLPQIFGRCCRQLLVRLLMSRIHPKSPSRVRPTVWSMPPSFMLCRLPSSPTRMDRSWTVVPMAAWLVLMSVSS